MDDAVLRRSDEEGLTMESVALREIADRFGTPCYVYSRRGVERRWEAYRAALGSRGTACYAVKANGTLAILSLLAQYSAHFDIVSLGELSRVLRAGAPAERITFSGVGKSTHEIRRALAAGIRCLNVESAEELARVQRVAAEGGTRAPVALRVNPDVDPGTHPHIATGLAESKFGVPIEEAESLLMEAQRSMPNVRPRGLAFHIGSQLTSIAPIVDAAQRVAAVFERLRAAGLDLEHIDAGGGLGIRYEDETPPTPEEHVSAVLQALEDVPCHVYLEPGRAIVGEAGILLTRVEYCKETPRRRFAVVDAGMNDCLRPALYDAWHRIEPVAAPSPEDAPKVDVVGPVCESADCLGHQRPLAVQGGDLLAVHSVGAYGFVMTSHYNARPRPPEVMVDRDRAHLVRRRETVEDLMRGESVLPGG